MKPKGIREIINKEYKELSKQQKTNEYIVYKKYSKSIKKALLINNKINERI